MKNNENRNFFIKAMQNTSSEKPKENIFSGHVMATAFICRCPDKHFMEHKTPPPLNVINKHMTSYISSINV